MTDQDIKDLNNFLYDHLEHFDCLPMEFEASSGLVYKYDDFIEFITIPF